MTDKQQANVIFAVHFDDVNDPKYKEITALLMSADMWSDENLVSAEVFESLDDMRGALDKMRQGEDDE